MTAIALLGVLHPVIITRDLERSLKFYRDTMGFNAEPILRHDPDKLRRLGGPSDAIARAVILKAPDGSEIEIACFARPSGKETVDADWPDAGIRSITFRVADIMAMLARMEHAGYGLINEVVEFPHNGGRALVAYIKGPDDVVLTLMQEGY
jgi:catechol 2,3-dioxygenase-like lactoylglutathione lyase family enzyme